MVASYTNPADMASTGLQSYDITTGAIVGRTLTPGAGISITNGNGVSGNPTIASTSNNVPDATKLFIIQDFLGGEYGGAGSKQGDQWICGDNTLNPTCDANHPGCAWITGYYLAGPFRTDSSADSSGIELTVIAKADQNHAEAGDFVLIGFHDTYLAATAATDNMIGFKLTSASANWRAITRNTDTETDTDTTIACTTNWTVFKIIINQTGTSVAFYIDGVLVATNTTNIPATSKNLFGGIGSGTLFTGGGKSMQVDYVSLKQTLSR